MNTKHKHSPLPWIDWTNLIVDANHIEVCEIYAREEDVGMRRSFVANANAAFICHAVNHHHELVDKLERMVEVFNCSDPDELKAFYAVEQSRGVLAKVKGGQP